MPRCARLKRSWRDAELDGNVRPAESCGKVLSAALVLYASLPSVKDAGEPLHAPVWMGLRISRLNSASRPLPGHGFRAAALQMARSTQARRLVAGLAAEVVRLLANLWQKVLLPCPTQAALADVDVVAVEDGMCEGEVDIVCLPAIGRAGLPLSPKKAWLGTALGKDVLPWGDGWKTIAGVGLYARACKASKRL